MATSVANLSAERLQPILEDGEFVLYRQRHPTDTPSPSRSLLVVIPRSEHPRPQAVRMLEHEHALRGDLHPAWALRPVALTTLEGRPALVLEDPGGELILQRAGRPMDVANVLRVGAGVAAALRQLHGCGLIHKDIKPANVMTDWGTGQVWLRGFGIASRLPRERRPPEPPEFIAGTLAYMAPEQTGWMNRSIDARSDLYALGVVIYELMTGSVPFTASDPMAGVHAHIAGRPVPPAERRHDIPDVVSAIVMKLLAKTAEDRYQTAAAVERDLRQCLAHWEAEQRIDAFALAEDDTPDRLVIPEKLYGRAREIDTLIGAFERVVTSGTAELVLVSGYTGIGKSSVVNELHKALVPARGLFASGKFDQYKRDIPYATLAQAFQSLIRQLLGKSESELERWRAALHEAVEPNGRLMVDLVPELTLLMGDQPPVPELPLQDAQRRFHLVFRRFIGVFARPDRPLALFLDDLQWVDAGTLAVLEDLLTQRDVPHLLLIGAYRDHEVDAAHPLRRTLDTIRASGAHVQEISLVPLAPHDVGQLLADALRCPPARVAPLAQLVHNKTAGNPFFAMQFIGALADDGLLTFDHGQGCWLWDVDRIHAMAYTDNVVDLVVGKLHRLPVNTQEALQQLACLGNTAAVSTLALVRGTPEEAVHADLWEAVRYEVIERLESGYRFIHDRVQEAAYSLIPEERRAAAHLRIGRLLAAHTPPERQEEAIFDIVNQLNRGAALIGSRDEHEELAELNLRAGERARASTAYASALNYLVAGAACLPEDAWERRQDVTFALERNRAECEFLTGALTAAEERLVRLATRATTAVERASVACLLIELFTTLGQSNRAVVVGLDYFRHLGLSWSPHPTDDEARREYDEVWSRLGNRSVEELLPLPMMSDPTALATMEVLIRFSTAAYLTDANLATLVNCRAVNLVLELGNCDGGCQAYAAFAFIAGWRFGDYHAAFRFGQLGCQLVEQRGLKRFSARVYLTFATAIVPWTRHVRDASESLRRGFEAGHQNGDLTHVAYCHFALVTNLLAKGVPLSEVQREAERGLAFVQKAHFDLIVQVIRIQLALVHTLRGLSPTFGSLDHEPFDEVRVEHHFAAHPELAFAEGHYWCRKLQARFFAGDQVTAVNAGERARGLLGVVSAVFENAEYHLYGALSRAATCEGAAGPERQRHLDALAAHYRQLEIWAAQCPENFANRVALVGAEIARLEGRALDAMDLYERAIHSARANGFVHHEALAHELAGRFYLQRGCETAGVAHLGDARACYALWGADGKVRQLDERYPHLRQAEPGPEARGTIGAPVEHLELTTVLNVSQAVSGELVLDTLVETLLRTAIEHAGAERGVLIEPRGEALWIRAEGHTTGSAIPIVLRDVPFGGAALPESVVRYAARVHETVHLDDASTHGEFSNDEYIRREHAKSMLCLPLLQQGRLMAVLYLENNLAAGVFTQARMAVLKVLAAQAAMSLEKSRLFRELQQREARIRRLFESNIIGIFIYDLDGRITDANDAFLRIVGYDRDDLVSGRLRWTHLTPPEWLERDQRIHVPQLKTFGVVEPFEKEYFRKDGSRVPVLVGGANFEDHVGEGVGFVLDLTERKRAEEARTRAEAELQQTRSALAHRQRVSLLGEVAASLVHEIKAPIAAAMLDAHICLGALGDNRLNLPSARDAASRMLKDATWADEVISRTSALYRKGTTQRERVDVNAVIQHIALLLQQEAAAASVSIRTALADGLPAAVADRVQLQQVCMNLMLNAIEAMKGSGGDLTIASAMREPGELLISVSDQGVGLPKDTADTIFEAFVTTKPQGTGMGLAITRSIVDAHGGRVWASANAGPGATFFFTLLADATEPPASASV
jgi:PAS domain S-box-containing protein